jgi:glycine dehydrogenase
MREDFCSRHVGPSKYDLETMFKVVGVRNLDHLIESVAPPSILKQKQLDIGKGLSEIDFLKRAKAVAGKNKLYKSYIGQGYYGTHTPNVVLRNILENPGWYTAYTPYQAEISQGRMEALLNFQTMVIDLTGLPIANASLLDEATAAAEAMSLCYHSQKRNIRKKFFVDQDMFIQTVSVLRTRAEPLNIEIVIGDIMSANIDESYFAVIAQYPTATGVVRNYTNLVQGIKKNNVQFIATADILSLCVLKPPGEWGADVVVGSTQRFGVPMGFGGPHAAYMSTTEELTRLIPGRIIGVSKDKHGEPALRLSLQTREQHIRREKATSNICTAQVLLAVMSSMYAIYHGPKGLINIANRIHELTSFLYSELIKLDYKFKSDTFFDTLCLTLKEGAPADQVITLFHQDQINLGRWSDSEILISIDETTDFSDIEKLLRVFTEIRGKKLSPMTMTKSNPHWPQDLERKSDFLTHPTFRIYHSETEMLRYIHRLEQKDFALNQSMIPLGSCTMKLNATSEMIPVTWPEFNSLHPFVPLDQAQGYLEMIHQLENWLSQITGFAGISLQPNAGSQGEYAGMLVIRAFHRAQGQSQRNICLIPTSAHGTNPASTVMAGFQVIPISCDDKGNVDVADLKSKAIEHKDKLGALMITYPSTHGVFEDSIKEICEIVHQNGGQVYMDGANFNALVGVSRPGEFGPDVCHLNLHKTFCIPHGGGGPGVGPIGVATHLTPFLPRHSVVAACGPKTGINAVSAAPWGSASILPISWAYIAMMGAAGLMKATQVAILNANYIAKQLSSHYNILYQSKDGWVAHECIIDCRQFKLSADVTVDDIAKRLADYGFHAPTMSWPVPGTLMIEPTESESLSELDRFCEAMVLIRAEIQEIEDKKADRINNVLKNAPHSIFHVTGDKWDHPYSREKAAYPLPWVRIHKFWPSVGRVDNVFGDRNLICACPPVKDYIEPLDAADYNAH